LGFRVLAAADVFEHLDLSAGKDRVN
jgi:hypothetical protein